MKFSVLSTSAQSTRARLGSLTGFSCDPDFSLETPCPLVYTRLASDPFLAADLQEKHVLKDAPYLLNVPLSLWSDKEPLLTHVAEQKGFRSFINLSSKQPFFLTISDPLDVYPTQGNDKNSVSLLAKGGKVKIDMQIFLRLVSSIQPDLLHVMPDAELSRGHGAKRPQKAVDNTLKFLDAFNAQAGQCGVQDVPQFVSIVGGFSVKERLRCVKSLASRNPFGYVLDGFRFFDQEVLQFRWDACVVVAKEVLCCLPDSKPVYFPSLSHPIDILKAVDAGVDLFDGALPYTLSKNSLAWLHSDDKENCWVALQDKTLISRVSEPLDSKCSCLCCKDYSLGYVCHLVQCEEILGLMLLMIHNHVRMRNFFQQIRDSLSNGTFTRLLQTYERTVIPDPFTSQTVQNSVRSSD